MKIAFFSDTFHPSVNGVASSLIHFSQGLSDLGHQVILFIPKHPEFKASSIQLPKDLIIIEVPSIDGKVYPDLRIAWPKLFIHSRLKQFQPDIIHIHSPLLIGLSGLVLGKSMNIPTIFTHGTKFDHEDFIKIIRLFRIPIMSKLLSNGFTGINKRILNLHDHVIVSTKSIFNEVADMGLANKSSIVPIPVPLEILTAGKKHGLSKRRNLGIHQALIYVGRLSHEKNIDMLIKVFDKLAQKHPQLKLVIIGDGPYRNNYFSLSSQLGILDRIIWTGEIKHQKLVKEGYYYLGDIFVTFSRFETLGLSTIEAMACGLIPVGVKNTATEEVIGDAGITVNYANIGSAVKAIDQLLQSPDNSKLNQKAILRAKQYSINKCTNQLVDTYTQIINNFHLSKSDQ